MLQSWSAIAKFGAILRHNSSAHILRRARVHQADDGDEELVDDTVAHKGEDATLAGEAPRDIPVELLNVTKDEL